MNRAAIIHEAKSNLAYAYDKETLHVRIKTQKGEIEKAYIKACDPFDWVPSEENPDKYVFNTKGVQTLPMKKECSTRTHDVWFVEVKGFPWLRIRYAFILQEDGKQFVFGSRELYDLRQHPEKATDLQNYFNFPYINEEDIYCAPSWVKDTIWYQVTLGCYSDNGDACETPVSGNIKGMIKKLDYIQDMGYTGIYFTPIFEASSWHKYDTTNYMKIDPAFGSEEDFREFIKEAHRRGIRIMLDAVFNHCGFMHPYWQDVVKNGKSSVYYDCFYIMDDQSPVVGAMNEEGWPLKCDKEDLNYRTFGFVQNMPKWNTSNPIVKKHLLDVAKYWVDLGIDGWRLDVSNEVSHDFWREFRKVVKGKNEDIYILGENWDHSYPWLMGDQFDGVMNYSFMTPVLSFLCSDKDSSDGTATRFKELMNELLVAYPKNVAYNMYNLVTSHDVDRLMTVCNHNPKLVKLAYLLLLTSGGSPSVYYGDEVGMAGEERNNRVPMIWDEEKQNLDLKSHIKKMIALRKYNQAFRTMEVEWLMSDDETNTIVFSKEFKDEKVYVIIHNASETHTIPLPASLQNKTFKNIYDDTEVTLEEHLKLSPYKFHILI